MADAVSEFGDVLFWQTPLPEVALCEVVDDEVDVKESGERGSEEEDVVQLEKGGDCYDDGGPP